MAIERLDHVNVRTTQVEVLATWYEEVLGLKRGPRPDFGFPGAWLYVGHDAVVHLVEVAGEPENREPKIEHFALSATGMKAQIAVLEDRGIAHSIDRVPGFPVVQINLRDPDGNHIHVDYNTDELA